MKKLVQIKGANGSGKTTIVKQLIALEPKPILLSDPSLLKGKPYATVLPKLGWVAVGHYPVTAKGGGCDLIHTVDELKYILNLLALNNPSYHIVFEGVMVSTTMTMYNHMLGFDPLKRQPLVVMLMSDMDGAIKRLSKRKGVQVSPEQFTQLAPKIERMVTQIKRHDPRHLRFIYVDDLDEADMVWEFLACCEE